MFTQVSNVFNQGKSYALAPGVQKIMNNLFIHSYILPSPTAISLDTNKRLKKNSAFYALVV